MRHHLQSHSSDLAATPHTTANQSFSSVIPKVPSTYGKLPEILTETIQPIYISTVSSFSSFLSQPCEGCLIIAKAPPTPATTTSLITLPTIVFDRILSYLSQCWTNTFKSQVPGYKNREQRPSPLNYSFKSLLRVSKWVFIEQSPNAFNFLKLQGDGTTVKIFLMQKPSALFLWPSWSFSSLATMPTRPRWPQATILKP